MDDVDPDVAMVRVQGADLAVATWARSPTNVEQQSVESPTNLVGQPDDLPTIVLLHEGLGSITQWRTLPEALHAATGRTVVAYDRAGYGRSTLSDASATARRYQPDFMHTEALDVLPALLDDLGVERPVLVGHSDGASIAMIAAARGIDVAALALIAPHVLVEDVCLEGIRQISTQRDAIVAGLARHHRHPDLVFDRWRDIWLDPAFRAWDITGLLGDIATDVPVTAVQGDRDEYATDAMLALIGEHVPQAATSFIRDCGHVAHRDQPDDVIGAVVALVAASDA